MSTSETRITRLAIGLALLTIFATFMKWIVQSIHNIYFHQLKKIPGPLAAKVFSNHVSITTGNRALDLLKLHEQYGPYVRIGPNEVSISDCEMYRKIYNPNASVKDEGFYRLARVKHEHIFSLRNKQWHAARRKMQNRPYSQQSIDGHEQAIQKLADKFIERVCESQHCSTDVDVYELCHLFSLEVIVRVAFNNDLASSGDIDHAVKFLRSMHEGIEVIPLASLLPFVKPFWTYIPGSLGRKFTSLLHWETTTRGLLQNFSDTLEDGKERANFVAGPLLQAKDDYLGRKLTEEEVLEEAMGLAFAGSGTTATTILYTIYHLSKPCNRSIQLKLRQELQTSSNPNLTTLRQLPYLTATINESMRLHPAIIGSLPRTLTIPLAIDLPGRTHPLALPAGTTVCMQNYVHHRNAEIYPQPEVFDPERWIDQNPSSKVFRAFTPFSHGPRNCIGQNLAKAEVLLAVGTIFRSLDVSLGEVVSETEDDGDMRMVDHFAADVAGKKLRVRVERLSNG